MSLDASLLDGQGWPLHHASTAARLSPAVANAFAAAGLTLRHEELLLRREDAVIVGNWARIADEEGLEYSSVLCRRLGLSRQSGRSPAERAQATADVRWNRGHRFLQRLCLGLPRRTGGQVYRRARTLFRPPVRRGPLLGDERRLAQRLSLRGHSHVDIAASIGRHEVQVRRVLRAPNLRRWTGRGTPRQRRRFLYGERLALYDALLRWSGLPDLSGVFAQFKARQVNWSRVAAEMGTGRSAGYLRRQLVREKAAQVAGLLGGVRVARLRVLLAARRSFRHRARPATIDALDFAGIKASLRRDFSCLAGRGLLETAVLRKVLEAGLASEERSRPPPPGRSLAKRIRAARDGHRADLAARGLLV